VDSFRQAKMHLKIHFTVSAALLLCRTMRQCKSSPPTKSHEYRNKWQYVALEIDEKYAQAGPHNSDVIDTSNLADHLGAFSILTACRPPLGSTPTSTIRLELLLLRDVSMEKHAKDLLHGDFSTVSMLLGPHSSSYWANTTSSSPLLEIKMELWARLALVG
jgi:hypothetical protein